MFTSFGVARLASAGIQAVGIILLARFVTADEYGSFSAIFAFQATVFGIGMFGISTFVLREFPRGRLATVRKAMRLNNWTSIASIAISLIFVFALPERSIPLFTEFCLSLILAISMFIEKDSEVRQSILIARGQSRQILVSQLIRPLLSLAVLICFQETIGPLLAFVIGRFLGALTAEFVVLQNSRIEVHEPVPSNRVIISELLPFALLTISTSLATFDVAVVGTVSSDQQTAFYAASLRILTPVGIAAFSVAQVFMSSVSTKSLEAHRKLQKSIYVVFIISSVASIPISILTWYLLPILFGDEYAGASIVAIAMSIGIGPIVIIPIIQAQMLAMNLGKMVIATSFSIIVPVVGATFFVAHNYGAMGAAILLVCSQWLMAVVSMLQMNRSLKKITQFE